MNKPRTELQKLEVEIRGWPEIERFEVSERLEYISLDHIRAKKPGGGIGTLALKRLQEYAQQVGVPIILCPNADNRKKAALQRFYRRLGFKKATRNERLRYGNGWCNDWIWKPSKKFNVKFQDAA